MKGLLKFTLTSMIAGALLVTPVMNEVTYAQTNKATTYVNQAIYWGGVLKKQLSVDSMKGIKSPDTKIFNNTKQNLLNAKKELSKMKGTEKSNLEKKLHDQAEIYYARALAYIDAINSGKMLLDQAAKFDQSYKSSPVSDATQKAYNDLLYRINKTTKQLNKVDENSTRQALVKEYITPAETMTNAALPTMTTKKAIDDYRKGINKDWVAVEQLISKINDPDIYALLKNKYHTGNDTLPEWNTKYRAGFQKLHYAFSSQTVAVYPGKSVQIGLRNYGDYWQLTMHDWDTNYWEVTRKTIAVVWGDDNAGKITSFVDYALFSPGSKFTTPYFSTRVVNNTLVIDISLPRN